MTLQQGHVLLVKIIRWGHNHCLPSVSGQNPSFSPHCLKRAILPDFLSQWNNKNTDPTSRNVWKEVYLVAPCYSWKYAHTHPNRHHKFKLSDGWGDSKFFFVFKHRTSQPAVLCPCFSCACSFCQISLWVSASVLLSSLFIYFLSYLSIYPLCLLSVSLVKSKLDPESLGIILLGPFLLEFFPDQVNVSLCAEVNVHLRNHKYLPPVT